MIRKFIQQWKAETNPDHEFCDDHEWVGSKKLMETCPDCEEFWQGWIRDKSPYKGHRERF